MREQLKIYNYIKKSLLSLSIEWVLCKYPSGGGRGGGGAVVSIRRMGTFLVKNNVLIILVLEC